MQHPLMEQRSILGIVRDKGNFISLLGLLLTCSAPIILILMYKSTWHGVDVPAFRNWHSALANKPLSYFYMASGCNYPVFGCFISHKAYDTALLLEKIFGIGPFLAYKYVLAIFDVLNIFFIYKILRMLVFKRALLFTLIIAILPSTRTNGSFWGQWDGILLLLTLIPIYFCLKINQLLGSTTVNTNQLKIVIYSVLSLIAIILGTFSKQLFIFNVPVLLLMCLYIWIRIYKKHKTTSLITLVCSLLIIYTAFMIDASIPLPVGFKSHMAYIFSPSKSYHGGYIAHNGFNIWVSISQTATENVPSEPYAKYASGIFIVYSLLSAVALVSLLFRKHKTEQFKLSMFIFCLGLFNLAFNVLLVGTHERYLYLAYPLLLIALFSLPIQSIVKTIILPIVIVMASYYGMFVASFITRVPFVRNVSSIYFLSISHGILLLGLTIIYVSACKACAERATLIREQCS